MAKSDLYRRMQGDHYPRISDSDVETGPGKTQPHHAEECDINFIVERYLRTGDESILKARTPFWGDHLMRAPKSLQEASERLLEARVEFMKLPSHVRREAQDSPTRFYDMVVKKDPRMMDLLVKHGLANVVSPSTSKAKAPQAPQEPKAPAPELKGAKS